MQDVRSNPKNAWRLQILNDPVKKYVSVQSQNVPSNLYEHFKAICSIHQFILQNLNRLPLNPDQVVQSYYNCGFYSKALEMYQQYVKNGLLAPNENFPRCIQERFSESKLFNYNKKEIILASKQRRLLNIGNFMSQKIMLQNSPAFGNHFIATENIKIGEILMVEKCCTLSNQHSDGTFHVVSVFPIQEQRDIFMERFVGKDESEKQNLNMYGTKNIQASMFDGELDEHIAMMFKNTCLINHCCNFNVQRFEISNVMFIRACKNIIKGEQIFIAYFDPLKLDYSRFEHYNFFCRCNFCKNQMLLPIQKLSNIIKNPFDFDKAYMLDVLEQIYKLEPLDLGSQFFEMVGDLILRIFKDDSDIYSQISTITKFFSKAGINIDNFSVDNITFTIGQHSLFFTLAICNYLTGQHEKFRNCVRTAYKYWDFVYCGFVDMDEVLNKQMPPQLMTIWNKGK